MGNATDKQDVVVLLSAGLDSTVSLASVLNDYTVSLALTFDYGQRAALQEKQSAKSIAEHFNVPHQVIELPMLKNLLPQALAQRTCAYDEQATKGELFDVNRVWVPNRNGIFLNIAAAFAESIQASYVVFGANQEEGASFPDNTPGFRKAMTTCLSYSTLNQTQVLAPLEAMSKQQIIEYAIQLNTVPFNLLWSCYNGEDTQCGQCPSCLRVKWAKQQVEQSYETTIPISFL